MIGHIDFAGQIDTTAEWILCAWSDRTDLLKNPSLAASIMLRGARTGMSAQVCSFERTDIGNGVGLLIGFDLAGRTFPPNAWTRLGRVELLCGGKRLKLTRAREAFVLANEELRQRLRNLLPHAEVSELRERLMRFAYDDRLPDAAERDDLEFIGKLLRECSPLLNRQWLETRYGIPAAVLDDERLAVAALCALGDDADFTTTPLFDPNWYRRQIADMAPPLGFFSLLRHYLATGEPCGLSPNAFFPLGAYADGVGAANAPAAGSSHLEQFLRSGSPAELTRHVLFDWWRYDLPEQEDESLARLGLDRFSHYIVFGQKEQRQPNPLFDEAWYIESHADVAKLVADGTYPNGFSHFIHQGENDNLSPNAFFVPTEYLRLNDDVRDAIAAGSCRSAFRHYWIIGWTEQRATACDPVAGNVLMHLGMHTPWSDQVTMQAIHNIVRGRSGQTNGHVVPDHHHVAVVLGRLSAPLVKVLEFEPPVIYSGESGTVHVGGLALLPFGRLVAMSALFGEQTIQGEFFCLPRGDMMQKTLFPQIAGQPLDTGFFASFRISAGDLPPGLHPLRLMLSFADDSTIRQVRGPLLTLRISAPVRQSSLHANVQVCMATYRPRPGDLERQVGSILRQQPNVPDIVISDDATPLAERAKIAQLRTCGDKIAFQTSGTNFRFVANFERAIRCHSTAAEYILLSDQDDQWESHKVASLRKKLDCSDGVCAFSDMSVVDAAMKMVSPTFWSDRTVHHGSSVALAVANAVTGAAVMLWADFANRLVPFPRFVGIFHDQWLSVAAAACGPIAYVDEPLYRYVQHDGNVLGFGGSRHSDTMRWRTAARLLNRLRHRPVSAWTDRECDVFLMALGQCNGDVMQRFVLLHEALVRFPVWSDPEERQFASELCDVIVGGRPVAFSRLLWSWRVMRRRAGGDSALLGIDYALKAGITAMVMTRIPLAGLGERLARRVAQQISNARTFLARAEDTQSTPLERKIAPVPIEVRRSRRTALRVNLLVPELRQEVFFGGYYTKFALLRRLRDCGIQARVLLLDQSDNDEDQLHRIANAYPALAEGLLDTDLVAVGNRTEAVSFGCRDAILATTWWSAHVAEVIRKRLGHGKFLYLIQEFEPFTFPLGTWYRAAEMSYDFPHIPLYSTDILLNYFKSSHCGAFAVKRRAARANTDYLVFENPIVARHCPAAGRDEPRGNTLLFYARPQSHAARNMYDFGVSALRLVVQRLGRRAAEWQFVGLGADESGTIELAAGISMSLRRKTSHAEYLHTLHQAKVGLALIYTPHPSLVPLEMAAAGLCTVTNACLTKDAASFAGISDNIIVAPPDPASIAETLLSAIRITRRASWRPNLDVKWPATPKQAFPDQWMARFVRLAEASLRPGK